MLTWNYKETDELWQRDQFKTEEGCILDAKGNYGMKTGYTIAIGTVYPYTVSADVDVLLEQLEQDAYEECGEAAENWDISSRIHYDEQIDKLHFEVTECVERYLSSINEVPSFYRIDDIYTVKVI